MSGHKIVLNGFGRIGRLIYSGTDVFHKAETTAARNNDNFLDSLTSVINKQDYNSLVDIYKKVQKKYYPEMDIFNNRKI